MSRSLRYDVVLIDVTETPIERPGKSKNTFIKTERRHTR